MRRDVTLLAAGALLLIAQAASACQCSAAKDADNGDAHARALFAELDAAWNARDAEAFSAVFTEDVSFHFADRGEGFEGRAALFESFAQRFPTFPEELRHVTEVREASGIVPGVVAVDGGVEVLRISDDGEASVFRSFSIFALVEEDDDGCRVRLIRIWQLPDRADSQA